MQAQRTRDTAPELAVRRLLHAAGLRYRIDRVPLPGLRRRADIVFGPARLAVYIDGCFWHGCPMHGNQPRANSDYWQPKLQGNRQRDAETDWLLAEAGWTVLRAWEHEDPSKVAQRVQELVVASLGLHGPGTAAQSRPARGGRPVLPERGPRVSRRQR